MSIKHTNDIPKEPLKGGKGTERQVLIGSDEGPNFALRKFTMAPDSG
jgi:quercetin dioxygenase-like cupin family protein